MAILIHISDSDGTRLRSWQYVRHGWHKGAVALSLQHRPSIAVEPNRQVGNAIAVEVAHSDRDWIYSTRRNRRRSHESAVRPAEQDSKVRAALAGNHQVEIVVAIE